MITTINSYKNQNESRCPYGHIGNYHSLALCLYFAQQELIEASIIHNMQRTDGI